MKKSLLMLLFLSTLWSYAQVSSYSFSQTSGTYAPISGGTQLGSATTASGQYYVDPTKPEGGGGGKQAGPGMDIGFNFTFNGFVYNKFGVNANGYISLGTSSLTPSVNVYSDTRSTPLSVNTTVPDNLVARISALATDLVPNATGASLSYQTIGDSPNKVLVVQWENFKKSSGGTGDLFNFQIRLHETTNVVSIVYGACTSNATANAKFQVGLRAAPTAVQSNFVNRTSTTGWSATAQGISTADTVSMSDVLTPSNGLTFSWTPPTCGGATGLVVSAIGANGATLTWNSNLPAPASGYEYIVTTSSAYPTVSGTETANATATVGNLTPYTVYYVFLRSNCGAEYTPWSLGGIFKTKCADATSISENFDSYATGTFSNPILPACWENVGTGEANVSSTNPASGTRSLIMRTGAVVKLPPVSNLEAVTHRLRFKATTTTAGKILDIGYLTNPSDMATFTSLDSKAIGLPTAAGTVPVEYYFTPALLSGIKNLVFKNSSTTPMYIDDVVWEPVPLCREVTGLVRGNALSNSITFKWTKSASTENDWQYVYGPAGTTANPDSLTPVDVSGNTTATTASVLQAQTSYKVWVRSKCHATTFGLWIGPLVMSTTCAPASVFVENFDATTALPSCWTKISTTGTATVVALSTAPSTPNVLKISATSVSDMATLALPPLSNAGAGTHRLRLRARADVANAKLDIGYVTDISDVNSYQYLQTVTVTSTTVFDAYTAVLGSFPQANIVFRHPADPATSIYIDEVVWEPVPTCPDITALASTAITNTTATIGWTKGGSETAWQYVLGTATAKDPSALSPVVDVLTNPTVTIPSLSPSTAYKVWVRSKCIDGSLGAWFGPVVFSTSCASGTAFSANFDANTTLPSCWTKVGGTGTVAVNTTSPYSLPNALSLSASSTTGTAVIAMPPVSNAGAGTHRLRFKVKATTANTTLEVGYLGNFANPASFSPLYSYTATQNTSFENKIVEMGVDPSTDYLAFRVLGTSGGTFYIDDVVWEKIPPCADVSNVAVSALTGTTATVQWTKGASETAWQYVKGDVTVTDPSTLVAVNVTVDPTTTIIDLSPSTSYKLWVRSNCGSGKFGVWSDPITFKTTCVTVTEFAENFDANTSLPACWTVLADKDSSAKVESATGAPSSPNHLVINSKYLLLSSIVVGFKPVSNAGAATHRLRFKCLGANMGNKFDVGYLTNPSDASTFQLITTITTTATYETIKINDIGGLPGSNEVLAFRIPFGSATRTIYIDDLVWEPLPSCADVSKINVFPTVNSATVEWSSAGSETKWQVSVRPVSATAPDVATALTADVTKSLEVPGLSPSSTYKVWVRSVCGATSGDWVGPIIFNTECLAATALNETFTVVPSYPELPVCWSKIVKGASADAFVSVSPSYNPAAYQPYDVTLFGSNSSESANIILVSPRLSGLSAGTLKFWGQGGTNVEVGTLNNNTDAAIFTKKQEVTLKDDSGTNATVVFSGNTTDEYIGIRLKTVGFNQYAAIDNITWDAATLANDQFDLSQFSYYPNPVKDVLNISYINNITGVTVYNLLGQEVAAKTVNENFASVDMSALTRGTYLVKVTSENQVKTIKVVKE